MRYYFDLTGAIAIPDTEGYEFDSLAEACLEAVKSAGEYVRDVPEQICHGQDVHISVKDETGAELFAVDVRVSDKPVVVDNPIG